MNRVCLKCCAIALSWQPYCEHHRLVGETFDATIEVERECSRHEVCGCANVPEMWSVRAEVAENPVEEEWCVGEILAVDPRGDVRTLAREDIWSAEDALIAAAERATPMRHSPIPYVLP
jgi:hypothetical protein